MAERSREPVSYTHLNDMVKRFVDKADQTTRDEIEKLVAGGFVERQLRLDLTYDEIDNTIDLSLIHI